MSEANSHAQAGDTVILLAGVYEDQPIVPRHSGADPGNDGKPPFNWITFVGEPGQQVRVTGKGHLTVGSDVTSREDRSKYALLAIEGKDFIWIENIAFHAPASKPANTAHIIIGPDQENAEGNTPDYVVLKDVGATGWTPNTDSIYAVKLKHGYFDNVNIEGLDMKKYDKTGGYELFRNYWSQYLVFKDCSWGTDVHTSYYDAQTVQESFILFKGNRFENRREQALRIGATQPAKPYAPDYYALVEDCTFTQTMADFGPIDGKVKCKGNPSIYSSGQRKIIRYNKIYNASGPAISMRFNKGVAQYAYPDYSHNAIYNNVVHDLKLWHDPSCTKVATTYQFLFGEGTLESSHTKNLIINNIMWKLESANGRYLSLYGYDKTDNSTGEKLPFTGYIGDNAFESNIWGDDALPPKVRLRNTTRTSDDGSWTKIAGQWLDFQRNLNADPLFADPDNADFSIAESSPARDHGREHATAANDATEAKTLLAVVCHHRTDGPWKSRILHHVVPLYSEQTWQHAWIDDPDIKSDLIKIGDADPVRITRIDYDHDDATLGMTVSRISLEAPRTWSAGAGIYFCHDDACPKGEIDAGIHEY